MTDKITGLFQNVLKDLQANFLDWINWIYMISLLFSYPDHPVYPVKKWKFLYYQVIFGLDMDDRTIGYYQENAGSLTEHYESADM